MNSKPWIEIVAELRYRWNAMGPLHQRMIDVRDRYNGSAVDYVVPFDTNKVEEEHDALTPPLVAEAVDNLANKANEVTPGIICPAIKAGKEEGVRSRQYAIRRRQALSEMWEQSRFDLIMGRAYRHLAAYGTMAMAIVPDVTDTMMPRLRTFDPLSTFPDPLANEDVSNPKNVGFITGMSAEQIISRFGEDVRNIVTKTARSSTNDMWDVALWCDEKEWVMGIMGPRQDSYGRQTQGGDGWQSSIKELWRTEHNLSQVPFVIPRRVTLDVIMSQLSNLVDQTDLMAKLMRLQIAAAEKAIFPDRYVIGNSAVGVTLNDGTDTWMDGRDGGTNVVLDAESIGNLSSSPDPVGERAMDRLERNVRVGTGLTPQTGGETYGALRTGRAIDALHSAAVDPRVRDMQKLAMAYLPHLNECGLEMFENHPDFRDRKYYLFSGAPGDFVRSEFIPSTHVEGVYDNKVIYSVAGAGINEMNVVLTGMVGAKLASRESAREMHPLIKDAVLEHARIVTEDLEEAMLQGLLQQLISGTMPPIMAALVEKHQSESPEIDIFEAVRRADADMRALQAQQVEASDPAAQPGLAPGAPAAAQLAPDQGVQPMIAPPGELAQVRELNNAMRGANQRIA